ncbi:hypothetical protein [Streptomyces lavendofoliae]|uniref:hypothetical protein n=1 Tax=Streptomyces lavendofoliae TaxID=67314 RepID=UPI003D89EE3D
MNRRRLVSAAAVIGLGASLGLVAPGSVSAQESLIACGSGNQTQRYSPGLTNTPRDITIHVSGSVGNCADPANPDRAYATFEGSGQGKASCLLGVLPTTVTYKWSDGGTSKIYFQAGVDVKPAGQSFVTVNGVVIAGEYEGHHAVKHILLTNVNIAKCSSQDGLDETGGSTNLIIT